MNLRHHANVYMNTQVDHVSFPQSRLGSQIPFLGREHEMAYLLAVLAQATHETEEKVRLRTHRLSLRLDTLREPQCVFLTGEGGVGKTRMVEEVSCEAQRCGWNVVWSSSRPYEAVERYGLWGNIVRTIVMRETWVFQEISTHPFVYAPLLFLVPELQLLLPSVKLPLAFLPEHECALWEALCQLLTTLSTHKPLLLVLDDMHWSDKRTCERFLYLARHMDGYAFVMVALCCESELPVNHVLHTILGDMYREQTVSSLQLGPLNDAQMTVIVSQIVRDLGETMVVEQAVKRLIDWITSQVAGNPFFAVVLAYSVLALPVQHRTDRYLLTHLPAAITDLFEKQLASLENTTRHFLVQLSKSNEFCESDSATEFLMLKLESLTFDETLLESVEEAVRRGILQEEGKGQISYRFRIPLFRCYLQTYL